jgi:hypothetical protein
MVIGGLVCWPAGLELVVKPRAGRPKTATKIARIAPIKIRSDLDGLILLTVFISPSY